MRRARFGNLLAVVAAVAALGALAACAAMATPTPAPGLPGAISGPGTPTPMAAPPTTTPIPPAAALTPGTTPVPVLPTPTHVSPTGLLKLASLPENPCDVLTVEQVSAATGLQVTAHRRVPTRDEEAEARTENRAPTAERVCRYDTTSEFGGISLMLPSPEERTSAAYWEARSTYFRGFPGNAQVVAGLGEDAWLGAGLHVLVGEDVWLTLRTQHYQPGSRDLLVRLASAAISGEVPAATTPLPTAPRRSPIPMPPTATPRPGATAVPVMATPTPFSATGPPK